MVSSLRGILLLTSVDIYAPMNHITVMQLQLRITPHDEREKMVVVLFLVVNIYFHCFGQSTVFKLHYKPGQESICVNLMFRYTVTIIWLKTGCPKSRNFCRCCGGCSSARKYSLLSFRLTS